MFAEAFRIHHGFGDNRLMSSRGEDTTVLYGILSNLCMLLLTDPRPTHVALVQDAPGKTFRYGARWCCTLCTPRAARDVLHTTNTPSPTTAHPAYSPPPSRSHELYQGYKGHREEPPETVSKGVECATDVLHALGVRVLRIPGVEADDVIASLACRAAAEGVEVDIVSGDKVGVWWGGGRVVGGSTLSTNNTNPCCKTPLPHTQDFFQILRPNVRLLRARRRTAQQQQATSSSGPRYKAYSDVDFMQQYPGLTPAQWVDYLALKGDAVDNVPGVRVRPRGDVVNVCLIDTKTLAHCCTSLQTTQSSTPRALVTNQPCSSCKPIAPSTAFLPT